MHHTNERDESSPHLDALAAIHERADPPSDLCESGCCTALPRAEGPRLQPVPLLRFSHRMHSRQTASLSNGNSGASHPILPSPFPVGRIMSGGATMPWLRNHCSMVGIGAPPPRPSTPWAVGRCCCCGVSPWGETAASPHGPATEGLEVAGGHTPPAKAALSGTMTHAQAGNIRLRAGWQAPSCLTAASVVPVVQVARQHEANGPQQRRHDD